jgi:acyl-coenzyme A thioesterase PaaI-like protein
MLVSEGVLKWVLRFFPPLFFQRIRIIRFEKGFRGVEVGIRKSFLNTNYNDSIFGGTVFCAADPFYPVLFYQVLKHKGYKVNVWSRSLVIRFLKPCKTDLHFKINISEADIADCEYLLKTNGRYRRSFPIEIYDKNEKLCVTLISEVYVRNLKHPEKIMSDDAMISEL